jgi:hypothetical protein
VLFVFVPFVGNLYSDIQSETVSGSNIIPMGATCSTTAGSLDHLTVVIRRDELTCKQSQREFNERILFSDGFLTHMDSFTVPPSTVVGFWCHGQWFTRTDLCIRRKRSK